MLGGWISRGAARFVVLFASVLSVSAQIDRGTIQGVVRDQTGAVIAGAKIQIIRIDTNSTLDLATNEEGLYTAPNLPVGDYRNCRRTSRLRDYQTRTDRGSHRRSDSSGCDASNGRRHRDR